ncbi:hypothetical protein ILYODFUR_007553, partial [Ilyodon furcidens]
LEKNLPLVSLERSSSLFPLCCTPYHPLPVHPSTPAFGRNHCYTQSLPGCANLSLHRCTCFPCSQIQPRPPKTSLKFPDQTMFPAPHYRWLVPFPAVHCSISGHRVGYSLVTRPSEDTL